ncbi:MAG: hypothetical protein RL757_2741 [Bacteroidota bacterium]|jgi:hypothetical protein
MKSKEERKDDMYRYLVYSFMVFVGIYALNLYIHRYDEEVEDRLLNGVNTTATIYRYERFSGRSPGRLNIFYYYRANDFLFYGSTSGNIPNCENDSLCVGRTHRVRYLPSNPNVHQIFFFDKRNGINWTDTIPEKR